jgi:glycosyltransferase involved in cell wall biosynthesis
VYPALRQEFLETPLSAASDATRPWLVVSALEPYKRVDLAIQAANKAGHELVVVGGGSQRKQLERLAGPTVKFAGRVSDAELMAWYGRARLVLFPQVEDFGLVAVEAQACGAPVVARRDGGAVETVVEGVTGRFFGEPTVEALLEAIAVCPDQCAQACRANAERFSAERFDAGMRAEIQAVMTSTVPNR